MCQDIEYDYKYDDWQRWAFAIPNFFVCGAKLKVDPDDSKYDERGVNGLKITLCH